MASLGFGTLGLPIIGIDGPSLIARNYSVEVHLVYRNAVEELPLGRAIKARLENDARVQSLIGKTISRGSGSSTLQDVAQLAQWWLWRANDVGTEIADRDLDIFLEADQIETSAVLWVYGLSCASPIDVISDVQLVNIDDIQNSPTKESFLRANLPFENIANPPGPTAALVTNYLTKKVSPTVGGPDFRFDEDMLSGLAVQAKLQTLATILNCLPGVCSVPAFATSQSPPQVPLGPFAGSGGSYRVFDVLPRRITRLEQGQQGRIVLLFQTFEVKTQQTKDRLQRALFRLAQAKGRMDDNDRALDLGIALEMLLLNNEHKGQELPGQLNLHFRLRGSWLIGIDATERRSIYRALGKLYGFRSQIAHNGYSDELMNMDNSERQNTLTALVGIAERIFQEIIIEGVPDDWASLILGAP